MIDPDYERLTGQPYETIAYDWLRRRWIVERGIKIGKPAPIDARDGEELIREAGPDLAFTGHGPTKQRDRLRALLIERGPMTATEAAHFDGRSAQAVSQQMHRNPNTFIRVGKRTYPHMTPVDVWGVVGIHEQEPG